MELEAKPLAQKEKRVLVNRSPGSLCFTFFSLFGFLIK